VTAAVLLVATRSADKLREIRQILGPEVALRVIDLRDAGIDLSPEEDHLEDAETFEENALLKARHFATISRLPTIADDSGLCVDALDGAPGVRSKRFSGREDLAGSALHSANNALLLELLRRVPEERRRARYVCALALVDPDGTEHVFRGECAGAILENPRGEGGFGYDPLFFVPAEDASMAELSPDRKNALSHRAAAVRAALPTLRRALDPSGKLR
jgi:XTP/dITP diphosphohydrolase